MTFFVVIVLLSGVDVGLQLGWVDFVLHKLFPVIVVLDWIVDPPTARLMYRDAVVWLVIPSAGRPRFRRALARERASRYADRTAGT